MLAEEGLPAPFRLGLRVLREHHCPDAGVAIIDGNFALIDLGEGPAPDGYVETSVRIFARMPLDLLNAQPYGVATIPKLHRKDGVPIPNQHQPHQNVDALNAATGGTASFWSWDWTGMGRRRAEDLALAYEWAHKCLRDGAR